jgi:hypothetical protein
LTNHPDLQLDEQALPLLIVKEELEIQTQKKITGVVRLEKTIRMTEAVVEEGLVKESFSVEHVPVNRYIDEAVITR